MIFYTLCAFRDRRCNFNFKGQGVLFFSLKKKKDSDSQFDGKKNIVVKQIKKNLHLVYPHSNYNLQYDTQIARY